MSASAKPYPLAGLKVLDMSRVLAGPFCGQVLADLGAEVIKIERPEGGDDTRAWGPPYVKDSQGNNTTEAAYYLSCNRGKQSLTLNIASPEGQAIIKQLAKESDVLLENYKVGQLAQYGLDYASLSRDNPRLIYCSITGFGQTGPHSHKAGYDFITQGLSGLMSITGEHHSVAGSEPQKVGIAVSDIFTGLYSSIAILAALQKRTATGAGDYIDMALFDVSLGVLANMASNYFTTGKAPVRMGNAHSNIVPYQTFAAQDGHLIIACGNDIQFRKLCAALGQPELADDVRYKTNPQRVANRAEIVAILAQALAQKPQAAWIALLDAQGVPCGPVNTIEQAFNDPQIAARNIKVTLPHPSAGEVYTVANPIKMAGAQTVAHTAPPMLGQHTQALLQKLGYSAGDIQGLKAKGII